MYVDTSQNAINGAVSHTYVCQGHHVRVSIAGSKGGQLRLAFEVRTPTILVF